MRISLKTFYFFLVLISLTSCKQEEEKLDKENDIYTYQQFQEIFSLLVKKIEFEGYTQTENTRGTNLVFIDKEMSMGTREVLTTDGKQKHTETQERIVFTNKDMAKVLFVDLIYLKHPLNKDLLYINSIPFETSKIPMVKQFDDVIWSKKNLLFQVTLISTNGKSINAEESQKVMLSFSKIIKDIKNP